MAVIATSRICTRNSAITTQKYLAVARIDGVTATIASGSDSGSLATFSLLPSVTAWYQPSRPMPASRNSTLNTVHR